MLNFYPNIFSVTCSTPCNSVFFKLQFGFNKRIEEVETEGSVGERRGFLICKTSPICL